MALSYLEDLVSTLVIAVQEACKECERQHINLIGRFFTLENDNSWSAKMIRINLPSPHSGVDEEVKVPMISLVPIHSLMIDKLDVEFDAFISNIESPAAKEDTDTSKTVKPTKHMKIDLGGKGLLGQKKNNVKIKLSMKAGDPPEGIVRVNDNIIRNIP